MNIIKCAVGLFFAGIAVPAFAQSSPDDVRCFVLSNGFAQNATEEPARQAAAKSLIFYLGRLDARGNPEAVKSAMQSVKIDMKTASDEMKACVTRLQNAAKAIQSSGNATPPKK